MRPHILSVLFPIHKVDEYFEPALNSVIDQQFTDFEVIFLVSVQSLKSFYIEISRILGFKVLDYRVVEIGLRGLAYALNRGIELSQGDFIARMDADDVSFPARFHMQICFLRDNPAYSIVGCRVKIIDNFGDIIHGKEFGFYRTDKEIRRVIRYRNPMCHPALMFRKSVLTDVNGYLYGGYSEDHALFLRIARNVNYKFANLDEVLFYYRRHSTQSTDISNAYPAFYEISGFLFSEFLRSRDLRCIVGMVVIYPPIRRLRNQISDWLRLVKLYLQF